MLCPDLRHFRIKCSPPAPSPDSQRIENHENYSVEFRGCSQKSSFPRSLTGTVRPLSTALLDSFHCFADDLHLRSARWNLADRVLKCLLREHPVCFRTPLLIGRFLFEKSMPSGCDQRTDLALMRFNSSGWNLMAFIILCNWGLWMS